MTSNEQGLLKTAAWKWITRLLLIAISVTMLFPLLWNLYSSFKTNTEFLADAFTLPSHLEWDNYVRAFEKSHLLDNIWNSLFVVGVSVVVLVLCVIPCSYCLARYRFFGSKQILGMYMAAIFIQATYIMIPLFLQMKDLHLLNNRLALGVLYATMQFPFAIFLLSGFMSSIPKDYEEAAMIDGCGNFGVLRNVIVPMAKPGIVTVCMITAMSAWNEFPVALIMLTDETKKTMPIGLATLYEQQRYATDWGALFAARPLPLSARPAYFPAQMPPRSPVPPDIRSGGDASALESGSIPRDCSAAPAPRRRIRPAPCGSGEVPA